MAIDYSKMKRVTGFDWQAIWFYQAQMNDTTAGSLSIQYGLARI
jgi:hypothetical protein